MFSQHIDQTVDEFRYRWNSYKDNNKKILRGHEHKQAGFFPHFQSLDHNGFLNDTEITLKKQTRLTLLDLGNFGLIH